MKKTFLVFCLLMAMTVPVSAKDVYIATEKVGGTMIQTYAMDETLYSQENVCGVDFKMVLPNGNWHPHTAKFTKTSSGWKAEIDGKVCGLTNSVKALFDWVRQQVNQ